MSTAVLTREEAKQGAQEKKPRSKLPLETEELKKLDAIGAQRITFRWGKFIFTITRSLKNP
jgi:hypothetical protein